MPWRTIFFAVNFGTAILFFSLCIAGIAELFAGGGSPFAFLGGVCFIWPTLAFGVCEWLLHIRDVRILERPLGIVCGLIGAMAIFAFVANAAEAVSEGTSLGLPSWLAFGAVCATIAAYGLWCCWLRIRRRTLFERHGFSVDEMESS